MEGGAWLDQVESLGRPFPWRCQILVLTCAAGSLESFSSSPDGQRLHLGGSELRSEEAVRGQECCWEELWGRKRDGLSHPLLAGWWQL